MEKRIVIHIRSKAVAADDSWFYDMPKEKQKEYIEQHPNSKFAKQALKEKEKSPKAKKSGGISIKSIFGDKVKALPEEHREFFEKEQDKPGSGERKGIAKHVRTNKGEIVKHIKGQFKEWGDGCGAIAKLASGKKISDHEKKALKALVIDAAVIAGAITVTGGFAHGAALAMKHVGFDVLKDVVLKSVIRGTAKAMGASMGHTGALVALETVASSNASKAEQQNEKILGMLVDKLADFIENGEIPQDVWEKALDELGKTKPKKRK